MTDDMLIAVPGSGGDLQVVNVEAELVAEQAELEIDMAVRGRRKIARGYVRRVRRRSPDATPAEIITLLERHYVTAISVAGAAITVGGVAMEVGIGLIPGGGAAKAGTKAAAKTATKGTMKAAGKKAALGMAKTGATKAAALLPAGDAQLQFEITALFALAVADIHGLEYDRQQAHALVYGLSNGRVSQEEIAAMAADLANSSDAEGATVGQMIAGGRKDWSHWAETLADSLPGSNAQSLVRGVATGVLEDVRTGVGEKRQEAAEYGVGAIVGGATKFVFGRQVVDATRSAFPGAPTDFPKHLDAPAKPEVVDDEANRALEALEALEDAAKLVGTGVVSGAAAVGSGVASAAGYVARPFRSVDRDGDGVPDEPQALAVARGVVAAAGGVTRPFRGVDRDGDGVPDEPQALTLTKGVGNALASPFRAKPPVRKTIVRAEDDQASVPNGPSAEGM